MHLISDSARARLPDMRKAWPGEFHGPAFFGCRIRDLNRVYPTRANLQDPNTEPLGVWWRFSFLDKDANGYSTSLREFVIDYKGKYYAGLGCPSIMRQRADKDYIEDFSDEAYIEIIGELGDSTMDNKKIALRLVRN